MPEDVLRVTTAVEVGTLQGGMNQAAAAVQASTQRMKQDFHQATVASQEFSGEAAKLASAWGLAGAGGKKAGEDIANGAGVARAATREAKAEIALLGEEIGVRVPRHIRGFVAALPGMTTALSAAFSVTAAVMLVQILSVIPEKIHEGIDALAGWDKAAKEAYSSALAVNNVYLASLSAVAVKQAEINVLGFTGQARISGQQDVTNTKLTEEVKLRERLAREARDLNGILESRKMPEGAFPSSENPMAGVDAAGAQWDSKALPQQYKDEAEALKHVLELNKQVAESDAKIAQLRLEKGPQVTREQQLLEAEDARKLSEAQLEGWKRNQEAAITSKKQEIEGRYRLAQISLEEEIRQLNDQVEKKLQIELSYQSRLAGLAKQRETETGRPASGGQAAVPGESAAPAIARASAAQKEAREDAARETAANNERLKEQEKKQAEEVALAGIEAEKRAGDAQVAAREQSARQMYTAHAISAREETALLQSAEETKVGIDRKALGDRLALAQQEPVKQAALIVNLQGQLEALEINHQARMGAIEAEGARQQTEDDKRHLEERSRSAEQAAQRDLQTTTQLNATKLREHEISRSKWAQDEIAAVNLWADRERAILTENLEFARRVYGEQSAEYAKAQDQMLAVAEKQAARIREIQQQQKLDIDKFAEGMSTAAFTGFNGWIRGQQTFAHAMQSTMSNVSMLVIQEIEKMAAKWVAHHVLKVGLEQAWHAIKSAFTAKQTAEETIADTTTAVEGGATREAEVVGLAGVAAAAAFASTAAIPIVGPELAPGAAAAAESAVQPFAAQAAFTFGGIMPETGMAHLEQDEGVLTAPTTKFLQNVTNMVNGGGKNVTNKPNLHFNIHGATDPTAVASTVMAKQMRFFRSNGVSG